MKNFISFQIISVGRLFSTIFNCDQNLFEYLQKKEKRKEKNRKKKIKKERKGKEEEAKREKSNEILGKSGEGGMWVGGGW